jgi:hypothetical protein
MEPKNSFLKIGDGIDEDGKFNNHPVSEVVIKWNFRAAMPPRPWLKKH